MVTILGLVPTEIAPMQLQTELQFYLAEVARGGGRGEVMEAGVLGG